MHALTRLLHRVTRRERRRLRGRVVRRDTLAELGGQGRDRVLVQSITYEHGASRIARVRA